MFSKRQSLLTTLDRPTAGQALSTPSQAARQGCGGTFPQPPEEGVTLAGKPLRGEDALRALLHKHPRAGFGNFLFCDRRAGWSCAAPGGAGPLPRGQLPPNLPMHTLAAAVRLHDLRVTSQEVLVYGPGVFSPQSLQCLLDSLELQD